MSKEIKRFEGDYRFLSNFGECVPFEHDGITYPTSEHFYQAMKSNDRADHVRIAQMKTPGETKKAGKKLALRPDWDLVKDDVMRLALKLKFVEGGQLAQDLLDTGNSHLVEGNTWKDTYWGIDIRTGVGQNRLGKLLMERREQLRKLLVD